MKKISAGILALSLVAGSIAQRAVADDHTAENVLAIILGATVAMSAISAFDRTTNGPWDHPAEIGVANIEADAFDYLATDRIGPSLLKAYKFTLEQSGATFGIDEYARTFVANADIIKEAVAK